MRDVACIVIGAGPAGCAAAVQCKRLGIAPLVLDRDGRPGGLVRNAYRVENYPGLEHPLAGPLLAARFGDDLERFGVDVVDAHVERVRPGPDGQWTVQTALRAWTSPTVIVCTGTAPNLLDLPTSGPDAVRCYDELADLLEGAHGHVAIVGGGEAAYDYALSLARADARVTILVRHTPRVTGRLPALVGAQPRITVLTHAHLVDASPAGASLALRLHRDHQVETITVDAVLSAIGRTSTAPALLPAEFLRDPYPHPLELAPGLLLCGDARHGALGQVGMAVGDGLAAAMRARDRQHARRHAATSE